jgi:hypothetical protein
MHSIESKIFNELLIGKDIERNGYGVQGLIMGEARNPQN